MKFKTLKIYFHKAVFLLTRSKFDADYLIEKFYIEKVRYSYADRIESTNTNRYFWRSICQYKCQSYSRKKLIYYFSNLLALIGLPFLFLLIRTTKKNVIKIDSYEYLKINFDSSCQIPPAIREKTLEQYIEKKYLNFSDIAFAWSLFAKNKILYPELLFKFLLWISSVRPYLDAFNFKYLIQYCEYSPYSSLRKIFLNNHGILVTNVSHGEESISCRNAFSSFDQYFAWDITPKSVHDAMYIEYIDRFTFNPCADIDFAPENLKIPTVGVLWPALEEKHLDLFVEKINIISNYCNVRVRPHPSFLYSNKFNFYKDSLNAQISSSNTEDINSFIDSCSVVVGYLSAALIKAAYRRREVIYIRDAYLDSLMNYHDYYKKINFIDVDNMDKIIIEKYNKNEFNFNNIKCN